MRLAVGDDIFTPLHQRPLTRLFSTGTQMADESSMSNLRREHPNHGTSSALVLQALRARGVQHPQVFQPGPGRVDHSLVTPLDLYLMRQSGIEKAKGNHTTSKISSGDHFPSSHQARPLVLDHGRKAVELRQWEERAARFRQKELRKAEFVQRGQKTAEFLPRGQNVVAVQKGPAARAWGIDLKLILARFIEAHFDSRMQHDLEEAPQLVAAKADDYFDVRTTLYLRGRGYVPEDVVAWLWIITARDPSVAAARLLAAGNKASREGTATVPMFVLSFLLRQPRVNTSTLKLLWTHATDRLERRYRAPSEWRSLVPEALHGQLKWCESDRPLPIGSQTPLEHKWPPMTPKTIITMMIRFIRHARTDWPELLPHAARAIEMHVTEQAVPKARPMARTVLNFTFNKLLTLLAKPSRNFYSDQIYHQQAMHCVVRGMTRFRPSLSISREGHRAITSVLLVPRKTSKEVEWATNQALTWPPWRRPRLGIDEKVAPEQIVSRPAMALSNLQRSGYSLQPWDQAARVLSGWDTDNSPTIHTRSSYVGSLGPNHAHNEAALVWAARIRATRTVEEAWKVFLDFREVVGSPLQEPYLETFRKLVFHEQQQQRASRTQTLLEIDQDQTFVPGDSPKVALPAKNPRMRPFLQVAVPSVEQFLDQAVSAGVRPHGYLLSALLAYAPSLSFGRKVLERSALKPATVHALLTMQELTPELLAETEDHVLAALAKWFISRRGLWDSKLIAAVKTSDWHHFSSKKQAIDSADIVTYAFRLVCTSGRNYEPAWLVLFGNLHSKTLLPISNIARASHLTLWTIFLRLMGEARQVDPLAAYFFPNMCRVFTKAAVASQSLETRDGSPQFGVNDLNRLKSTFEGFTGRPFTVPDPLGRLEAALAGASNVEKKPTPALLLRVPSAVQLHDFALALMGAEDREGLVQLLCFIFGHQVAIHDRAIGKRPTNSLCAIRLGLEQSSASGQDKKDAHAGASQTARRILERTFGRQAWPDDLELDSYMSMLKQHSLLPTGTGRDSCSTMGTSSSSLCL